VGRALLRPAPLTRGRFSGPFRDFQSRVNLPTLRGSGLVRSDNMGTAEKVKIKWGVRSDFPKGPKLKPKGP